ncbi:MAG TPA: P1 family peptidase, partial [Ilumatobacteraceae bacterium]|nr:P1 family peptidase [Ilumatobacteraceae bacterium]
AAMTAQGFDSRPRPRDHGIQIGSFVTGRHNSITDVDGVRVGHATIAEHCTGVTAIVPDSLASLYERPMAAGTAVLNGAGELTGSLTIREWGTLETPILLTATMSVGRAYQGVVEATLAEVPAIVDDVIAPVVGECDDSWLSDPGAMVVTPRHAVEAINGAVDGAFAAGAVGAGSGMTCLGWKGGIGTSSRVVDGHVLGSLVLTNFGSLERLCVNGAAVGRRFAERGRSGEREAPEGSCIVVIATDAPLLPGQCERLARRAGLGLARTGSTAGHGSGEIFVAFSTGCRVARNKRGRVVHDVLADRELDGFFEAVVDATEEAVLDSLFRATTTTGRNDRVAEALPIDELLALM